MIPCKVMIVDDSRVFRSVLEGILKEDSSISVVASLWSGEKALEYIECHPVDVITLDVEMPGFNGIETMRKIQDLCSRTQRKIGVIMLSSLTHSGAEATLQALEAGAFDFLPKPSFSESKSYRATFKMQLLSKIKTCRDRTSFPKPSPTITKTEVKRPACKMVEPIHAIVIGVSTGGPKALTQFLPALTQTIDCPIIIVQHMPPNFTRSLADSLNKLCRYKVVEAQEGQKIEPKTAYIAPGGFHLILRKEKNSIYAVLNEQPPENGCRPSVDVLFRSAGSIYGKNLLATILTGMGCDGAASLRALKRSGATIFAQDEASSVVWGMPGSAVATGVVDCVSSLDQLPLLISQCVTGGQQ